MPDFTLLNRYGGASSPTRPLQDASLGLSPAKSWSLSIQRIFEQDRWRFDATHYDPAVDAHVDSMAGIDSVPLRSLATLKLPGRFERVWAIDADSGHPYLNATDLLCLFALGRPSQVRYLSPESETDIDNLHIREDWLLMTCSGTIGRVYYVPKRLDGWAATHDLIRIIPNSEDMSGYFFAWCSTKIAQVQILSHTHGGQINHVTAEQVGQLMVPLLPHREMKAINDQVVGALHARETAMHALENSWPA